MVLCTPPQAGSSGDETGSWQTLAELFPRLFVLHVCRCGVLRLVEKRKLQNRLYCLNASRPFAI